MDACQLAGVQPHALPVAEGGLGKPSFGTETKCLSPIECWGISAQGVTATASEVTEQRPSGWLTLLGEVLVSKLTPTDEHIYTSASTPGMFRPEGVAGSSPACPVWWADLPLLAPS